MLLLSNPVSSLHLFFSVRLPPGTSLFDTMPSHMSTRNPRKYCTCQTEPLLTPPRARFQPDASSDSSNSTCSSHGNVHLLSIIPTLDVTSEYIGSVELVKSEGSERQLLPLGHPNLKTQGIHIQPHERGLPLRASSDRIPKSPRQQHHRSRRQTHRYISSTTHQSLSQSDLEGLSYFFPEDHEPAVQPYTSLTWPTPSGLTEEQARIQCQQAVVNSSIALGCRRLLEELTLSRTVTMCVNDLQLKDEQLWLNATLPLLENECERRVVEERRREEEYQDVLAVLRCPSLCNGNGQCSEWGCVCFPGFGSYDCSVLSGNILYIHQQRHTWEGLCRADISNTGASQQIRIIRIS